MINIDNVKATDILPYSFNTAEALAFATTVQRLCANVLQQLYGAVCFGDVAAAAPTVLNAMAAEIGALFYADDMPVLQKRSVIASSYENNARIGTTSSVIHFLSGSFGTGYVEEWQKYNGQPWHFKALVKSRPPLPITRAGYNIFENSFNEVKPMRTRLDSLIITRDLVIDVNIGATIIKRYNKYSILPGQLPDDERGYY